MANTAPRLDTWKFRFLAYFLPVLIGVLYIWLTYHDVRSGASEANSGFLIQLSIALPEIAIWTLATVCAVYFKFYTASIKKSSDGQSLSDISTALLLLVVYIILLTTSSAVVSLFNHSDYLNTAVILRNHLPILVVLLSVAFLYTGSRRLLHIVKRNYWSPQRVAYLIATGVLFFTVFAWRFYQSVPNLPANNGIPKFATPVGVLLITYVLPHVALWFLGLAACVNVAAYSRVVKGKIYRQLFRDLYRGILMVFICIFIAQFLIISTISLAKFNFALVVIYLILLLSLVGFWLVWRGVKNLYKIEST